MTQAAFPSRLSARLPRSALVAGLLAVGAPIACGSDSATQATSVPVSVATTGTGAYKLTARIRLGGDAPIVVQLDSGSTGLRIDPDVLPSGVTPMGPSHTETFGGERTLQGPTALVPVTIGGVTTPEPIAAMVVETVTCGESTACRTDDGVAGFADLAGISGIMGIGLDPVGLKGGVFNPLLQLAPEVSSGFAIAVDRQAGGTLTLGQAAAPEGAVAVAVPPSIPLPNGRPGWEDHHVALCWRVGSAVGCGSTILDTGGTSPEIPASFFTNGPVPSGAVARGTPIELVVESSRQPLWSFPAGTRDEEVRIVDEHGDDQEANAGIGVFFSARSITYDAVAGRIWVARDGD